jgi:hypothetical protein
MANAVAALAENNRMGAIMGLGGLASPRFASAMAWPSVVEWGGTPDARRSSGSIRTPGIASCATPWSLRVPGPMPNLFGPSLRFAESAVASIPITVETPPGYRKVRPPGTANDDEPAPPATNAPWKLWN